MIVRRRKLTLGNPTEAVKGLPIMTMDASRPLAAILITTRNREAELLTTLRSLEAQSCMPCEVIVNDDASSKGYSGHAIASLSKFRLIRQEQNIGYIEARNVLMRATSAEFLVHLDDDANWLSPGAINAAIRVMEENPNCGIFSFRVHEAVAPPVATTLRRHGYPVRSYTGCGHIIARWAFDKLGPLRSDYYFYCEEVEYCLRALEAGIQTLRDDGLIVHHRVDWAARDQIREKTRSRDSGQTGKDWRVRMAARNELWWISELVPWPILPFYAAHKVVRLLMFHGPRGFGRMVVAGVWEWFGILRSGKVRRHPVSLRTFRTWLALPA